MSSMRPAYLNMGIALVCAMTVQLANVAAFAQARLDSYSAETRISYEHESANGKTSDDDSGFKGQYLNILADGHISDNLSFSFRHRLNKTSSSRFFDATDWAYIVWKATEKLSLSAGKQVVAIGGFEYDRAPIDLYYCSEFWNNIACYQLGASLSCSLSSSDEVMMQICNSPMRNWAGNNTYGLSLKWNGSHGIISTIWSANLFQNTRSEWINYISLGNRINLSDGVHLDADIINRATGKHGFLLEDWSLMSEFSAMLTSESRWFIKYTHDENSSGVDSDHLVLNGTAINQASAGVEYSPLKERSDALRLFAACGYSWGANSNAEGVLQSKQLCLEFGMKVKIANK